MILKEVGGSTKQRLTHKPHNIILLLLQFCCLINLWTNPEVVTCSHDCLKHLLGENKSKGKRGKFRATILCSKPGALKPNIANVINAYRERNVECNWAVKSVFTTLFQIFSLLFGSMILRYEIKIKLLLWSSSRGKESNYCSNCSAKFC